MNDKQQYSDVPKPEDLSQETAQSLAYEFGYIRLKGAAWTSHFNSPIYIGEVILDLSL